MADFNLIQELFPNPTSRPSSASPATPPAPQIGYTKRTWKISDEHWEEFTALAKLLQKTQADLINDLIAKAVEENTKEISEYRKFFSKK